MTVYADVLFAINFSMDFLAMFLALKWTHKKIYKISLLISAGIGGIYGVLDVILSMNRYLFAVVSVLVSFLMCVVALKELVKIKQFVVFYVVFLFINVALGGIMTFLYNLANQMLYRYLVEYSYETAYTYARFFTILALTFLIGGMLGKFFIHKKDITETKVVIQVGKKVYSLTGLVDSGNVVKEPFSARSVVLIGKRTSLYQRIGEEKMMRYVPFESMGKSGILKGILPEKTIINDQTVDAVIAQSENYDFDGYDCLVPKSLI